MTEGRVASLHVYPIKGCRELAPPSAQVAITGLATAGVCDREWMVVAADGRFVTQREQPRLALVDVAPTPGALRLAAPGRVPLDVPATAATTDAGPVVVWQDEVRAFDAGDAASAWFSEWLDADVRLVRFDRAQSRPCNPEFAGDSGAHTFFADGYPVLVIGAASLAELNARLAAKGQRPVPMNRFRPNLVVAGLPAFDEDHVDTIVAGDVVLRCVKPCVRCQVTTTDQATADVGSEPLRTLGEFRMDERRGGVTFGVNAIVVAGTGGTLAVGAPLSFAYRF